ncbi:hypothetical protein [Paenibacillus sp. OSY-SE]|uniref:hypothetical protein n=1 Tax=Paenibacillus sp. OSY-SE TaxID=1196323 RepID=UPI000301C28A|nr:hypothetical protein [Paenibacillus sp. OSY-SE]
MNKIGFTQKHRSTRYYKLRELFKKGLTLVLPIFLTLVIIACLFIFPSRKAWIIANGSPQDLNIVNFEGRIDSKSHTIYSKSRLKGLIINQQPLLLNVNGENFNLEPGDLHIRYGYNDKYADHWDIIESNSIFKFDMLDINSSHLSINKEFFLQRLNELPSMYTLNIEVDKGYISAGINEKNFNLTLRGNFEVFIKEKKYKNAAPYFQMNFTTLDQQPSSRFQFLNFDNLKLLIPTMKGELLFTGEGDKSTSFFETGNLKFNRTTSEQQYSLDEKIFTVEPYNEEKLKIAYSMTRNKNQLKIYGNTDNASLTGNSLFSTFDQWLFENMSTVIGTLVASLLGLIIVKKK